MLIQKPSIPKGTRDFLPKEIIRRNYIFNIIKEVFQRYGYLPIETPAMENLSTLIGKYGKEGDKLLFKILNSGDYLGKIQNSKFKIQNSAELASKISEKGLRYDLTVPFARFVAQHRNDIIFPFKRYQIQQVWRADKPQKGRYREFYQCDVDVIGSNSLLNEAELLQIIDEVFEKLEIDVTIKINNRKILYGIVEALNETDKFKEITTAIDKLDRIESQEIIDELEEKGLSNKAIKSLSEFIKAKYKDNNETLKVIETFFIEHKSDTGTKGLKEIQTILSYFKELKLNSKIIIAVNLSRGLDYYTGTIIEVTAKDVDIGSICGGGRYDDLTGIFGLPDVSGVGVSFGADRIYDVLDKMNKFPDDSISNIKLMFVNFGEKEEAYCLSLLAKIRKAGINAEIYPEPAKIKKQMIYANNKGIQYVALIGADEMKENMLSVKNMKTGEQEKITLEGLINKLK